MTVATRNCIVSILAITLSIFVLLALVGYAVMLFFGLLIFPNDSYNKYIRGGVYWSNSGSMSQCGEYLVFSSPRSGRGDIWRLRLNDSAMHQITNFNDFEAYPRYSPDGENIFYMREHGGHRHIWKTDKDGQSHEQLTFGRVVDSLEDVSPDGDSLIISRCYWAGGKGMAVEPLMIYSISNKNFIKKDMGSKGIFLDDHMLLYHTQYERPHRFGKYDLTTRQALILGTGFIKCLSPNKKIVCISRDSDRHFFNRELFVFDLDQQNETRVGTGEYPCFLIDSKVVFFAHPSLDRAYIYSLESGTTDEVKLPGTILTAPVVAPNDLGILLRLASPNDSDRSGNIYLFHGETVKQLTQ